MSTFIAQLFFNCCELLYMGPIQFTVYKRPLFSCSLLFLLREDEGNNRSLVPYLSDSFSNSQIALRGKVSPIQPKFESWIISWCQGRGFCFVCSTSNFAYINCICIPGPSNAKLYGSL